MSGPTAPRLKEMDVRGYKSCSGRRRCPTLPSVWPSSGLVATDCHGSFAGRPRRYRRRRLLRHHDTCQSLLPARPPQLATKPLLSLDAQQPEGSLGVRDALQAAGSPSEQGMFRLGLPVEMCGTKSIHICTISLRTTPGRRLGGRVPPLTVSSRKRSFPIALLIAIRRPRRLCTGCSLRPTFATASTRPTNAIRTIVRKAVTRRHS